MEPAAPSPLADQAAACVRLELQLRRAQPGGPWTAEIAVPGTSGRLAFPTLNALFSYLARLERPPGGLR